jgi:hypothetical protein
MEQIIIGIVIELTLTGMGILLYKLLQRFLRKVDLIEIKQDTWVEAYQIHSDNGLMESYKSILEEKLEQKKFINQV